MIDYHVWRRTEIEHVNEHEHVFEHVSVDVLVDVLVLVLGYPPPPRVLASS